MKKTVKDIDVRGKKVICRCDFNVPMKGGVITDTNRITAALPTINYLLDNGASVILMSHLGRPKGKPNPEFTLKPVADKLGYAYSTVTNAHGIALQTLAKKSLNSEKK